MSSVTSGGAPVSVVIPCYCCARTVKRAVESVAHQTLIPNEVVLVDDGSNDDTLTVLHEIQASYPDEWIRIIDLQQNRGPSFARNTGWSASSQAYIAFLDADDSWLPRKIEIQYSWMRSHPHVGLTGHRSFCLNDETAQISPHTVDARCVTFGKLLFSNPFSTPTIMLRADIKERFDVKRRYAEDFQLWLTIAAKGHGCWILEMPLTVLHKARYGESGLSSSMWQMEKGEMGMYCSLYREGLIPLPWLAVLLLFSLIKFLRRLIVLWRVNRV